MGHQAHRGDHCAVAHFEVAEDAFPGIDVATLTALLRETEEHHGEYEATAPKHHWWDWYAAYIVARVQGRTPEEAAKDGALHMDNARR